MKTSLTAGLLALITLSLGACSPSPAPAGQAAIAPSGMTAKRMGRLIQEIDPDAVLAGNTWRFEAAGHVVAVVYDVAADRMRILIPIGPANELSEADKTRLLQANFDSALDARYAIAQELIWGTFIHPLSPLTDEQFLLGLGQTVSVVETYGDTYSSGLLIFGQGDSAELERQKLLDLLRNQQT